MLVKYWMKSEPITVSAETLVIDAQKIMRNHNIRRLPVLKGNKLIGIVTLSGLREAQPSKATSLSIHELNYLLAKMTVGEIMTTDVITCSPDMTMEKAAVLGTKYGVGALPVVENGRLIGIITESDIYRAFLHMLGATHKESIRITLDNFPKEQDEIIRVISILDGLKGTLVSLALVDDIPLEGRRELVFRVKNVDAEALVEQLQGHGYVVSNVSRIDLPDRELPANLKSSEVGRFYVG
ncbi:MAG: CBS domain-containing protein [Deltaproteobacteria bacterium]|nr:CBS domain-containing protein [Deltaproteobacteria bacterium]